MSICPDESLWENALLYVPEKSQDLQQKTVPGKQVKIVRCFCNRPVRLEIYRSDPLQSDRIITRYTVIDLAIYAEKAQQVIAAGQFLYAEGWSPATSSNYSARIDDSHLAITVSGKHKGQLQAEDIMVVDLQGQAVQSSLKSSAETLLHCVLYDWQKEIGAVLHTHSKAATVLTRLLKDQTTLVLDGYELQKAFPCTDTHEGTVVIPIFDNTQDIDALAEESMNWLTQYPQTPAYLIRGHGLYTWGSTMADTLRHIEAMEFLMACELETLKVVR